MRVVVIVFVCGISSSDFMSPYNAINNGQQKCLRLSKGTTHDALFSTFHLILLISRIMCLCDSKNHHTLTKKKKKIVLQLTKQSISNVSRIWWPMEWSEVRLCGLLNIACDIFSHHVASYSKHLNNMWPIWDLYFGILCAFQSKVILMYKTSSY